MVDIVKSSFRSASLRSKILLAFFGVIITIGLLKAAVGYYLINRYVVGTAQAQTKSHIQSARREYDDQVREIKEAFSLLSSLQNLGDFKRKLGLDYLYVVDAAQTSSVRSEIVSEALKGNSTDGTRIIRADELRSMNNGLLEKVRIEVEPTPHSRPARRAVIEDAMAIEYALPFMDGQGRVTRVIYGGKIVNKRFGLVDQIHDLVYEDRMYDGKPLGTVTIFQDDVRVATNVRDKDGKRAVGTMVSAEVYEKVILRGEHWLKRAFVVTDWYLTAYEPITDIRGNRIGMLYVGTLEKPYRDLKTKIVMVYILLVVIGVFIAGFVSAVLSKIILRPVERLLHATEQISNGDLEYRIEMETAVRELDILASEFNRMADTLREREANLKEANEKLTNLNKNYLDLVGIVSHELKGVLSSAVLNIYSVQQGFLGEINDKQRKAVSSISRNLDYLTATVRRFLDLSRIEKGELQIHARELRLREDIFDHSVESFQRQAAEHRMTIENALPQGVRLTADPDLMLMVANNLVGNALKYGNDGGLIRISGRPTGGLFEVEVYNDGAPIPADKQGLLFRKFSRLRPNESGKARGTGLGLFLTKEIIERHGGTIRFDAREKGNAFIIAVKITGRETEV